MFAEAGHIVRVGENEVSNQLQPFLRPRGLVGKELQIEGKVEVQFRLWDSVAKPLAAMRFGPQP